MISVKSSGPKSIPVKISKSLKWTPRATTAAKKKNQDFLVNKNFEELQNLLQSRKIIFDVIAITETRIPKNVSD